MFVKKTLLGAYIALLLLANYGTALFLTVFGGTYPSEKPVCYTGLLHYRRGY